VRQSQRHWLLWGSEDRLLVAAELRLVVLRAPVPLAPVRPGRELADLVRVQPERDSAA
jgi:hypothetical protein